jgi:hypothetical protein
MPRSPLFYIGLVLVVLLSAELTARIEDRIRWGIPLSAVPDRLHDLTLHDSTYIRGRPNGRFERFRLNDYGFRSPPMAPLPAANCPRVMVLGASETFGLYESDGHEYVAQLRDRLSPHGCVEVINAAVAGLGLRGLIDLWSHWVVHFHPSVVIIYPTPSFYLDDPPPDKRTLGPEPGVSPWWTPRLLDHLHMILHYPDALQRRRIHRMVTAATAGHPQAWFFSDVPADRAALFAHDVDSLVGLIQQTGAIPILVTHAVPFQRIPSPSDAPLLEAWQHYYPRARPPTLLAFDSAAAAIVRRIGVERHVPVVDAAATLDGHPDWFADFTHFTDTGADEMADLLSSAVLATLNDPADHPIVPER